MNLKTIIKYFLFLLCSLGSLCVHAQNLQLHYDFRHSIDPQHTSKNFPNLSFEYFKLQDSGTTKSVAQPGSFLFKVQADLAGERYHIGKVYMQVSQSVRFWKPKIYMYLEYSGGLGVTEPKQYSYYINNAVSVGATYPFQWKNAWFSTAVCYRLNFLERLSHDVFLNFYWGKGFWDYKLECTGTISAWTQNKIQSDVAQSPGKTMAVLGEPQIWYNMNSNFSVGSRINLFYHVLTQEDLLLAYPTVAIKYKL